MNSLFVIRNILLMIKDDVLSWWYHTLYYACFNRDIWDIYNSYHKEPKQWKKNVWNNYMKKNSASISIDAQIESPLILPHGVSGIFITQSAKIGKDVVVFQQVTIGANTIQGSKSYGAPTIGNNVYIGAGAKIVGGGYVSDNVRVGANAVVVQYVPCNATIVCSEQRIIESDSELDNTFNPYLEVR